MLLHCFTHTVGADTPSATSGNDTINALTINPSTGAAATTLGAFDVIDGGAGSDTLNIYTDLDGVVGPLNRVQQGTIKNVEIINIYNGNAGIQPISTAGKYAGIWMRPSLLAQPKSGKTPMLQMFLSWPMASPLACVTGCGCLHG